jgi:hypothetical protein
LVEIRTGSTAPNRRTDQSTRGAPLRGKTFDGRKDDVEISEYFPRVRDDV